ncbi:efflux RND transporter periplasmic adaptor subunit [Elusimicrobiota bacterium]
MIARSVTYVLILFVFIAAVVFRARIAEKEAARETVSITSEWEKRGKPVDAQRISKGSIVFTTKVTGIMKRNNIAQAFDTPEIVGKLRAGQTFGGCGRDRVFSGTVSRVLRSPDPATGLYRATLKLRGKNPFKPAEILVACVRSGNIRRVLTIPRMAVGVKDGKDFAWVIKDDKASRTDIKLGEGNEKNVRVLRGLSEGDIVVTNGSDILTQGDRVRVRYLDKNKGAQGR